MIIGDEDEFDENDMMAAIEAEQAEAAAGGGDEEFDENDMMAAIAAEQAEAGGDDEFDENDMMAAIAAEQAEAGGGGSTPPSGGGGTVGGSGSLDGIELVSAVEKIGIDITAVLGTAEMKVSNLLKIGRGAVIELNRHVGDTIELRVAGRPIARGDVVVVEDHLAVSVTEVFKRGMFHDT